MLDTLVHWNTDREKERRRCGVVDERDVEAYLRERVKAAGGLCVKLTSEEGIPDRLVVLPDQVARVAFVETKRPQGGRVGPLQQYWQSRLRKMGCISTVIKSKAEVDAFLDRYAAAGYDGQEVGTEGGQ